MIELTDKEKEQRAINKLSPKARRVAGVLLRFDNATRLEVIKAFDGRSGSVKLPSE